MSLGHALLDLSINSQIVAGLGDGTSNNAIQELVKRVIAALSVIALAIFVVRAVMVFASAGKSDSGNGAAKSLAEVGVQFVIVMFFIFGAGAIASLVANVASGALGK